MKKAALAVWLCNVLLGCRIVGVGTVPVSSGEGRIYLYLGALPAEAARFDLTVADIRAVDVEGRTFSLLEGPLGVSGSSTIAGRLIATAGLPAGAYRGFEIVVARARLEGALGASDLLLPGQPIEVAFPLVVSAESADVLYLGFEPADGGPGTFRLGDDFTIRRAEQVAAGRIGVVTGVDSDAAIFFDKRSGLVLDAIRLGGTLGGIDRETVLDRVWIAVRGQDRVVQVDLRSMRPLESLRLASGDEPAAVAVTRDGTTVLVANAGSNSVSFVDARGPLERERIGVGLRPEEVLLDTTGNRAFVLNRDSDSVTVLDVRAARVAATIAVDPEPFRAAMDRSGERLYVIHDAAPYLTVLDLTNLSVARRVYVGPGATALTVDRQTDRIYLARRRSPGLEVYDPNSLLPVDLIPISGAATFLAFDGAEGRVLAGIAEIGAIEIIERGGTGPVCRIEVAMEPYWLVASGEK